MVIQGIFPTPVGFFSFRKPNIKEKNFIDDLEEKSNIGNTSSENSYVLKSEELSEIKTFLDECVSEYFQKIYQPSNEVFPYITQSWVNWSKENQFHHKHPHPNSFISGIYYVNAIENVDKIYFHKDEYRTLKLPAKEYNVWNSDSWFFHIKTGDVVLFPSSLVHHVENVVHKDVRISLAFNTFLKGYLGSDEHLDGLHL